MREKIRLASLARPGAEADTVYRNASAEANGPRAGCRPRARKQWSSHLMVTLYHAWSSMPAQAVRMALAAKRVPHEAVSLALEHDAIFFDLGIAWSPMLLVREGGAFSTDADEALRGIDGWAGGDPLFAGIVPEDAWRGLLAWRAETGPLCERLAAPALLAFRDLSATEQSVTNYRRALARRFGISLEVLANDRYDGYLQFAGVAGLDTLARRLAKDRFYVGGRLSVADLLVACYLFPLQLLDGVTFPIDLMYYIERVERASGASPREGLIDTL
jgi:glutathione S-transferase